MALITCPECKKQISDTADSCPNCGYHLTPDNVAEIRRKEEQAQKNDRVLANGVSIAIFSVVIIVSTFVLITSLTSHSRKPKTSTTPISSGQERRIAGSHWLGCADREYFEKVAQYASQGDNQAYRQAVAAGILTGECTMFKDGEDVYITDTAILSGLVKVRRKGKLQEYWTIPKAVK